MRTEADFSHGGREVHSAAEPQPKRIEDRGWKRMTDSMFRAHKKSSQECTIPNHCSTKERTISPQIQRRPQMGEAGGFSHKELKDHKKILARATGQSDLTGGRGENGGGR